MARPMPRVPPVTSATRRSVIVIGESRPGKGGFEAKLRNLLWVDDCGVRVCQWGEREREEPTFSACEPELSGRLGCGCLDRGGRFGRAVNLYELVGKLPLAGQDF